MIRFQSCSVRYSIYDGMDSRYSERDITGYSHFHLMDCPKGTMQWDTKYSWISVGNGGHV